MARLSFVAPFAIAVGCGLAKPTGPDGLRRETADAAISSASAGRISGATLPAGWTRCVPESRVESAHGMVSTDAAIASKVGRDVLASGGNAMDAATAIAFALAVVHPAAGNIGGGGFMVARVGNVNYALDFRETAPAKASRDMYLDARGKPGIESREGHRSVGVPGSVQGLWEAHQRLGSKKLVWSSLLKPAIALARGGFVVDAHFAKSISDMAIRLKRHAASAALFFPSGSPPAVGSTWKNPELATVLEAIALSGSAGFYQGPTATLIAAEMRAHEGLVTPADLAAYRAKWRAPIEFTYRGHRVVSMPPPSSGGLTLAMIANILSGYELQDKPWHSAHELHLFAEAMRRAFASRNERLGDPEFVNNPVAELTSAEWAKRQRGTISLARATKSADVDGRGVASGIGPHTTHFSVVDSDGSVVALTTTLNWWFGSGVTVTGGGFLLNNEMDDFASSPGTPNSYGLVQREANAIAPGKRMLSSMTPTIVVNPAGHVELVLGAAGGPTIISTVFGILSSVIDHRLDVATAVCAPRFHHQHFPDQISFERDGMPDDVRQSLGALGHDVNEREHIADAPTIGRSVNGWVGVSEPRRGGSYAAGW